MCELVYVWRRREEEAWVTIVLVYIIHTSMKAIILEKNQGYPALT